MSKNDLALEAALDSLVSLTGCRQQKTQESAAKQKPTRGGTPKRQTPTGTPRWTKKTAASDLQALFGVAEETSEPDTTERQTGREDESEPEDEAALASALEKAYRGNIFQKFWKWGVRAKCLLHTPGRMSLKRKSEMPSLPIQVGAKSTTTKKQACRASLASSVD
ncbi:hypothetical protein AB5N19_01754 [Seiridium cardinale]